MKFMRIIIIGIVILAISGIYIIQVAQNQQIDEILVTSENKGRCDESIDKNRNQIPDEFEKSNDMGPVTNRENIDFSNCVFPNSMAHFIFVDNNYDGADFSNTEIKNVLFLGSSFDGVNFSNSSLQGVIFAHSSINESNFTNTNFYPNPWKNPYIMAHIVENNVMYEGMYEAMADLTCYYVPCGFISIEAVKPSTNYSLLEKGKESYLNMRFVDKINDKSDKREIYRHVTNFYGSEVINSTFKNTNLSYVIFHGTDLSNTVIESSNISNTVWDVVTVNNTKINEVNYKEKKKVTGIMPEDINFKQVIYNEVNKKTQINDYEIDVNLIHVIDDIPINWSMGMTTFEQSLYVADTDNHRINVYDLDTLKKKFEFISPLSNYCETTNTWSASNPDCPNTMRNLPTSVAVFNEKIFVSYGFQDDIQIFDLNGKFLSKFGSSGNQKGEFSRPMQISASNDLLYIADSGNKRIQVVDSEGQFVNEFSVSVSDESDTGTKSDIVMDLDISKNKIFIINNKNSDLLIYDLDGNLIKKTILVKDTGNSSIGVEKGLVVVSDSNKHTVTIFDLDGVIMNEFGKYGEHYGEFKSPRGITVNDGKIYVSDPYNYRVQVFSMELK
jgi:hypothetical protein